MTAKSFRITGPGLYLNGYGAQVRVRYRDPANIGHPESPYVWFTSLGQSVTEEGHEWAGERSVDNIVALIRLDSDTDTSAKPKPIKPVPSADDEWKKFRAKAILQIDAMFYAETSYLDHRVGKLLRRAYNLGRKSK